MMPSEDSMKKITGDIADEASEAGIRLMATVIVKKAVDFLTEDNPDDDTIKTFLDQKNPMGEAMVGFALAAIFELTPISTLGEMRERLAYNLRVRSYEEAGEHVLKKLGPRLMAFKKFAIKEAENVRDWINGSTSESETDKAPKSDGRKSSELAASVAGSIEVAEKLGQARIALEAAQRDVARLNAEYEATEKAARGMEEKAAVGKTKENLPNSSPSKKPSSRQ